MLAQDREMVRYADSQIVRQGVVQFDGEEGTCTTLACTALDEVAPLSGESGTPCTVTHPAPAPHTHGLAVSRTSTMCLQQFS